MDTRTYGNSLGIYLATFGVETVTGIFRALLFTLLFFPFGLLLGFVYSLLFGRLVRPSLFGMVPDVEGVFITLFTVVAVSLLVGGLLAFMPLGFSVLSYWGAGGGYAFTRFALGARPPSTREWERLEEELAEIRQGLDREILTFSRILIIDAPLERVYTIGTTLYISSEAVRNGRHLGALLAHELGHLNHGDSGVVLSLRRLVFPLFYLFVGNITTYSTGRRGTGARQPNGQSPSDIHYSMVNALIFFVLATIGGGLGVWLCSFWWADYFRKRDFLADQFVVECGLDDQLIDYLEQNIFYDTSVPYMLGWQPAHELRLDRLLNPNAGPLPQGTAHLVGSPVQKYGGMLILALVAALAFTFFVPLGALSFWFSFAGFMAVGFYFRGSVQDLRALADWLFYDQTQTESYLRMALPAFLLALVVNFSTQFPSWELFWILFFLVWGSLYGLGLAALGINGLGSVLRALYAFGANYFNHPQRAGDNPDGSDEEQPGPSSAPGGHPPGGGPSPQSRGGSERQTHFERLILEAAAQQGPEALSLFDIRNLLIEITTRYRDVDLAVVRRELQRLVDGEYIALREDVRRDLEELLADSTLSTPQEVIQWLNRRMAQD